MQILFTIAQILGDPPKNLPTPAANEATFQDMLNIAFTIIGALAVLFMVIAGVRFIASQGDPARAASARNQILYAAIGLVIAVSAGLIVNFVLGRA